MKYFFNMAMSVAMFYACNSSGPELEKQIFEEEELVFEIIRADTEFDADGGYGSIILNTSGREYLVEEGLPWVNTTIEGEVIKIYITRNYNDYDRSTNLVIICDGETKDVIITQSSIVTDISATQFSFPWHGGEEPIEITSPFGYEINNDHSWLELDKSDSGLILRCHSTDILESRLAQIEINFNGSSTATISVQQEGLLSYENLLGEWEMISHDRTGAENPEMLLEFTPKYYGFNYEVTGLEFPFSIEFDLSGRLAIGPAQPVYNYSDQYATLVLYDGENGYYNYLTAGLQGTVLFFNGELSCSFTDDGGWLTNIADGFVFWLFDGIPVSSQTDYRSIVPDTKRYHNIRIVKKLDKNTPKKSM